MKPSILTWAMLTAVAVIIGTVIAVVGAVPVMLLWNALIPGLLGLKTILLLKP